jgi:capsular polysaccharide biosynthesis protein
MKEGVIDLVQTDQDYIGILDLWSILASQKRWPIGAVLICVGSAAVWLMLSKPTWEATAVIQIGQIGQLTIGPGPQLIEASTRTIERMKLKSFEDDVLTTLGVSLNPEDQIAQLFRGSLSLRALGTTELIQVRVRGFSSKQAATWAQNIADKIKAIHGGLTRPIVERLDKQLIELNKQMQTITEERSNLAKIVSTSAERNGDSKFSENLLLSNLLIAKNAEYRDFEMRRLAINEQLTAIRAYPTTLVDRVYVPEKPASPKKLLTLLLAAAVGLILGAAVAFLRSRQTRKDQS